MINLKNYKVEKDADELAEVATIDSILKDIDKAKILSE